MSTPNQLPDYITSATPNPQTNRAPWYKNTAPTYAGIFLWFVFWNSMAAGGEKLVGPGGTLAQGLVLALGSLIVAALICHVLFYLVPGLLGMETGLPLYIVGTSTFGATGGFLMPGFLMGVLQFGWLGVNAFASAEILHKAFPSIPIWAISVVWAALGAFMGLKGIQYVAKVASLLPLLPLVILVVMLAKTAGGLGSFDAAKLVEAQQITNPGSEPLSTFSAIALLITIVVGFFATAGAAGVDFGLNSRDKNDVQMGGIWGIAVAIVVTAGLCLLIVAGAAGQSVTGVPPAMTVTGLMEPVLGKKTADIFMVLLAIADFPPACFSAFIAANSFKTTLPKVNPFISVGIGTLVSIALAVTGYAGKVVPMFLVIGASFGPICGAMVADFLLNKGDWSGPRAGFNPAGWIAWALGFVVGILPNLGVKVPAAPVLAFIVGAVVFWLCAKMSLQTAIVPLPKKA